MAVALSIAIRCDLRSRMVVTPVTSTRRNSYINSLFYSENTTFIIIRVLVVIKLDIQSHYTHLSSMLLGLPAFF